jgi:uncharacterized membrane protein
MTENQEKPAAEAQVPAAAGQGEIEGVIVTGEHDGVVEAAMVATDGTVAMASDVVVDTVTGAGRAVTVATDGESTVISGVVADEQGVLAEGAIGVSGDDAIIVARFADMDAAKEAYEGLCEAEAEGRLDIEGVLVANADAEGKVHIVKMTDHKTRNGFVAGAVAGAVVGILFPPTILVGALWAGVAGGAIGKLRNIGAKSQVAKDLAAVLTPGSSGIIALAKLAAVPEVEKALPKAEEVKSAPVSEETAAAVKDAAKEAGATPEA